MYLLEKLYVSGSALKPKSSQSLRLVGTISQVQASYSVGLFAGHLSHGCPPLSRVCWFRYERLGCPEFIRLQGTDYVYKAKTKAFSSAKILIYREKNHNSSGDYIL